MNAAEQATSLEFASKIATVVNLFKQEFPDIKSDLKPWKNDPETRELVDPDSIDIGFHFPGISRSWQCRSVLILIHFYHDTINHTHRAIGLEVLGFDHRGQVWRLSTVETWTFIGDYIPSPSVADKLKYICTQVLQVFNNKVSY